LKIWRDLKKGKNKLLYIRLMNTYSKIFFIDATISRNMIISLHSLTILMSFYVKKPCGKSVKVLSQEEVKKLHKSIVKKKDFKLYSSLYLKQSWEHFWFYNDFSKWKHNFQGTVKVSYSLLKSQILIEKWYGQYLIKFIFVNVQ